ncbi:hypothetical protein NP233_g1128 [Leucocoprinus birnbaumii]|uniref:Uncharacterized protein n=1 Tax=Leucocoprinus birnbaumii TaxID=56174 RepID=A0AAD5W0I7_9AGAR|nr:hypothetical protein NP233_g1128 [Leucocoprinus birnbaumii]
MDRLCHNKGLRNLLRTGITYPGYKLLFLHRRWSTSLSQRIGYSHIGIEDGAGLRAAISGKALPKLSRAVLRGGQQYYFITLLVQFPVLIVTAIPSIPPNVKLMVTFPLDCLTSSMACRIVRDMKMFDESQHDIQPTMMISDVYFAPSSQTPRPSDNAQNTSSRERYCSHHIEDGDGLKAAISGKALPKLSKAILHGGQQYYFVVLVVQIPVLIITAIPSVPPNVKLMVTFPLGCLASSMACRIFRNMKMFDSEYDMRTGMSISDVSFAPSSRTPQSRDTGYNASSRERVGFNSRIPHSTR